MLFKRISVFPLYYLQILIFLSNYTYHHGKESQPLLAVILFKLTFLSLGSLFVLHISGKRSLTVTLLLCKS